MKSYFLMIFSVWLIVLSFPLVSIADYLEQANMARTEGNFPLAVELLTKAADIEHNFEACRILGDLYFAGSLVDKDTEKGLRYYNKAINGGYSNAMNSLSLHYLQGNGVQKDREKGLALLEKAASLGNKSALYNIASAWNPEIEPIEGDVLIFQKKLVEAAEGGNPDGQYLLAFNMLGNQWKLTRLSTGERIKTAYKWAKLASKNGSEPARDLVLFMKKQYGLK